MSDAAWEAEEEYELSGCDVQDAVAWAAENALGRMLTLFAVVPSPDGIGLVRLAGTDPNRA